MKKNLENIQFRDSLWHSLGPSAAYICLFVACVYDAAEKVHEHFIELYIFMIDTSQL